MPRLGVIIPFVNEWPLIATTIRSVGEALKESGIDFEVIAVDNWMPEVGEQEDPKTGLPFGKDRGHKMVESLSKQIPWLKVIRYSNKLSHWNAKNYGAQFTDADFLWFIDAHCIVPYGVLPRMFAYYDKNFWKLKGPLYLPLTYHFLEERQLIYRMRWRPEYHDLDYTFMTAPNEDKPYEVPCMSTCGMMIHRDFLEMMGWWPKALGIYGGGEHWINYTMAVMGFKKWIWPGEPLYHHGDVRGYRWNAIDYERNRVIAAFLFGGGAFALKHVALRDPKKFPNKRLLQRLHSQVASDDDLNDQRDRIKLQQVTGIYEFIKKWERSYEKH